MILLESLEDTYARIGATGAPDIRANRATPYQRGWSRSIAPQAETTERSFWVSQAYHPLGDIPKDHGQGTKFNPKCGDRSPHSLRCVDEAFDATTRSRLA